MGGCSPGARSSAWWLLEEQQLGVSQLRTLSHSPSHPTFPSPMLMALPVPPAGSHPSATVSHSATSTDRQGGTGAVPVLGGRARVMRRTLCGMHADMESGVE